MAVTAAEILAGIQALFASSKVRLIQRKGTAAQIDSSTMKTGELAVATDTRSLYLCYADGDIEQISGNTFIPKGFYSTLGALQSAHPTGNTGDLYIVGSSTPYTIYTWESGTWVSKGTWNDTSTFAADASVIHKTGDETKTGGLELTNGMFASGYSASSMPTDKNGVAQYWNTQSPIGGISGGVGRVSSFIKSTLGVITYKTLALGAYLSGSDAFALLLNADGSAKFGNGLDLNSKKITSLATPTATTDAANKSYVDGKTSRCLISATRAISNSSGTGYQTIPFPAGLFSSPPSVIRVRCVVTNYPQFYNDGTRTSSAQMCVYRIASGTLAGQFGAFGSGLIVITDGISNAFYGSISGITKDSFDILWERTNDGLTGTVTMQIEAEA